MNLVYDANSTFTTQELARLTIYRAAVRAGFYTDVLGDTEVRGEGDGDQSPAAPGEPAAPSATPDEAAR